MSIELVMPSNHLILCCPLLLLPSIFPSIRVFSNESVLRIRWPKGIVGAKTATRQPGSTIRCHISSYWRARWGCVLWGSCRHGSEMREQHPESPSRATTQYTAQSTPSEESTLEYQEAGGANPPTVITPVPKSIMGTDIPGGCKCLYR